MQVTAIVIQIIVTDTSITSFYKNARFKLLLHLTIKDTLL